VAGTASAVNGRVQRRQAEKFAERDAEIAASRQQAYAQQYAPAPAPAAAATTDDGRLAQLERLADLRSKGILSEEEFATEKMRILNG
jgi:hypothetical protein